MRNIRKWKDFKRGHEPGLCPHLNMRCEES